jgi:ABC-type multidrug transport system ATPase subunit
MDEGEFEWGYETSLSYFAQDHHENLKGRISAYDWLYQFGQQENISTIRGLLGRVLLSGDEALKSVSSLSGGEAARLLFAKLMLEKRNVLVLDEPTNHLDLEGVDALAEALREFPGTVIVVSHDRHFVSQVANHILELTPEGARDFAGSYQEYLEHFGDDYLSRDLALTQTLETQKPSALNGKQRNRKELKKLISKLTRETSLLEETISDQEAKIRNIDLIFSGKDFFKNAGSQKIENMQSSKIELEQELKNHLRDWETKTHKLEEARSQFEN